MNQKKLFIKICILKKVLINKYKYLIYIYYYIMNSDLLYFFIIIAIFAIYYLSCNCFISKYNNNETFESQTAANNNWVQCVNGWPRGEPDMKKLSDLGDMNNCCIFRCGSDYNCITDCANKCSGYCKEILGKTSFTCMPNPNSVCNNM